VTACNSAVSQVSHELNWLCGVDRIEKNAIECSEGYRILATSIEGKWSYSAFGPSEKITYENGSTFFRDMEYKAHYEIDDQVPPSYNYKTKSANYLIGCFNEKFYGSTDAALVAAKAACFLDYEKQQEEKREQI